MIPGPARGRLAGPAGLSIGGRPLSALAWPLASRYAAATPARRAYSGFSKDKDETRRELIFG